jgi:hypothetical protein
MNVTIRHVFDTHHNYKPITLRSLSNSKCLKYAEHYQLQCLAFATTVANSLDNLALTLFDFFGIWLTIKRRIRLDLLLIYQQIPHLSFLPHLFNRKKSLLCQSRKPKTNLRLGPFIFDWR